LDNVITQKILFEIEQIDELIHESSPLFDLCKIREPDFVERCGIAMILHSFYNGIENILLLIIKNKDTVLPNEVKWHKELFAKAFETTKNRSQIFRKELRESLNDYLQFRHFVRHSYGFQLKWEKMKNMLFSMNITWENIKEDITTFIKNN
jgi:predicted RNA methylase